MIKKPDRKAIRAKRRQRLRNKLRGTAERPRLNVYRSLNHIYAQVIDDDKGVTLVAASSLSPELKGKLETGGNIEAAKEVGKLIAKKALDSGVKKVVFDRAGYIYHGRVKALAEAAREGGLDF
ncbi:large subunit ribosomal protein L18 [Desulfohalotomaculum tongense]|uniref:50S ribosomal protein L18 n=1 Tax=Desulforadius tongensis TaxID=1216062 RepID=UPI001957F84B|nr:50S ribosomal protein L18 [Desulforadius tongensis]MBM7853842.1 large subunit ribosomal protein L18 [Desulforadius tongensis]